MAWSEVFGLRCTARCMGLGRSIGVNAQLGLGRMSAPTFLVLCVALFVGYVDGVA